MSEQPKFVDVDVYLLVEPRWRDKWWKDSQGRQILDGAKVVKVTQTRPSVGPKGGVITKLKLRMDAGAFLPLQPEAVIHIGPGEAETVEVDATDPRENIDPDEAYVRRSVAESA